MQSVENFTSLLKEVYNLFAQINPLNPVDIELNLIHFDLDNLKELIECEKSFK